jgi:hypothetical protein
MKWKQFEESNREYPEKIVEKSIEGFSKATKGLAELKISALSDIGRITSKIQDDFVFRVVLLSPHVKEYSLTVLTFSYGIELSPIRFIADYAIHMELYKEPLEYGQSMVCKNGEMFSEVLEKIFSCERFVETVAGLMKVARKNIDH